MKKKLFYLASILIGLTFAACSSDDGGSVAPDPTLTNSLLTHTDDATTLKNLDDIGAPFEEIALTETGRAVIGPFTKSSSAKQRRIGGTGSSKYIIGTYKRASALYTVYNEDGSEYCTIEFISKASKTANVKIRLMSASEIEEEFEGEVSVAEKIAADEATAAICREWTVATTRLTHKGGVKGVMQFERGKVYDGGETYDPSSLNDILRYAKTVASIDEDFDEDMTITSVEFTDKGYFFIFFKNGKHYVGKWYWTNKSKGYIKYDWSDEEMGNKFENGEGVFDLRQFQMKKYYTLTLGADVESGGDKYQVELSFYLNEKTK
ncbi:MAG: hypothetical protein J5790_05465 [Bacteroidaceae bacterium]|nr:hypothetical protein [Bacteroidaceae bacterium]